jgi:hypothetical protein
MLAIQEEQQENLVMSMDLDKMTPWVREFYISKQKELPQREQCMIVEAISVLDLCFWTCNLCNVVTGPLFFYM